MRIFTGLTVVALSWTGAVMGADSRPEEPTAQPRTDLELEEILVQGRRPVSNAEKMTAWLSRLAGDFEYSGYVERRPDGGAGLERVDVLGHSTCANMGARGLVQCVMNVSWSSTDGSGDPEMPSGTSTMTPAVALFAMYEPPPVRADASPVPQYIGHMQVGSSGIAEMGLGQLFDDTLIYKSVCADLPGDCRRVVHIEAPPDGKVIQMSVEIQRDANLEARYVFSWKRVPPPAIAENTGLSEAALDGRSSLPPAMKAWVQKLVGKFRFENYAFTQKCFTGSNLEPWERLDTIRCKSISSEQDCLRIGSGTGVRCVRDMDWTETSIPASRTEAGYQLWGYDPVAKRMVVAFATPKGFGNLGGVVFATGSLGKLIGETLTLSWLCPRDAACRNVQSQVIIPPDGRHVRYITILSTGQKLEAQKAIRIDSASLDSSDKAPTARGDAPKRPR